MAGEAERDDRTLSTTDPVASFLVADYRSLVVAVWTITGTRDTAEDLVQDALARTLDYLRRGGKVDDFPALVRTAAINLSRNRWRALGRERRALARLRDRTAERGEARVEETLDLHQAILRLPRREREAVALV